MHNLFKTTFAYRLSSRIVPNKHRFFTKKSHKEKVAVIGSGNWGSVVARIIGQNVLKRNDVFEEEVKMWVHEEHLSASHHEIKATFHGIDKSGDGLTVKGLERLAQEVGIDLQAPEVVRLLGTNHYGKIDCSALLDWWKKNEQTGTTRKLTQIINRLNENVKYLQGVKLSSNIIAEPNLEKTVQGASLLVFVTPHQFTAGVCGQLRGKISENARAISLTKGMEIDEEGFQLMSGLIKKELKIDCSVLMGANIANEIAMERFSEATIGYSIKENGEIFRLLFDAPYLQIRTVDDVPGPEMYGTLKNIVAVGVGFVDGLNLGNNAKAAIIRIGLQEMIKLSKLCFPSVKESTILESCGIADLITTCFGGRNRKVGEAFVLAKGKKTFLELEKELLGGQKLQGVLTSDEVQRLLKKLGKVNEFPLFTTINRIINGQLDPIQIVDYAQLPT